DHQSEYTVPCCVAWRPKYCSNTLSAAGAAAVPPWPPFSISAQTTSFGLSYGPYPHHHDWLKRRGIPSPGSTAFSAVPVLPAICTGKLPKTAVEVPNDACVASSRPWRITPSTLGPMLICCAAGAAG